MTTIFAVAVLAVTVGQQHVHAKPCPENSLFIYSYEHGEESHCACLEKTRCIGAKCVAGGAKNDVYGFYNTPYHSGFQSSCLDCYCLTSSQTASNVALSYPHKLRTSPDGQQFREFPDPLFEQSCRALPDHVPYKPPVALARQKWLHFPKAGSSFSSTIYHYACRNFPGARVFSDLNDPEIPVYQNTTCSFCWLPCGTKCGGFTFWAPHDGLNRRRKSKKGNYDYLPRPFLEKKCVSQLQGWMQAHYPMPRRSKTINGTGLAMFRHPARRLVSAFNYGRHSFGMNRLEKLRMLRVTPTLESYVNFPGIASCMTKMLLGQNCAHYVKLDSMLLEEAKRRVRYDLGFVGLSEHWNASICLFHRRYGGPMHPLELANLRPTGNGTEARKDVFNKVRQSVEGTETGRRLLSIEDEYGLDLNNEEEEDDAAVLPLDNNNNDRSDKSFNVADVSDPAGMSRQERNEQVRTLTKVDKSAANTLTPHHDPYDWAIYEFAEQEFRRHLQEYGLQDVSRSS